MLRADERFRIGVTQAGRTVLRGIAFVALATLFVPALGVLCALAFVLAAALVVGFVLRPRVRVDGHLPDRIVAGRATRLSYKLQNRSRLPAYDLCMRFAALPETMELVTADSAAGPQENRPVISRLGPGDTADATLTIRATRRGRYRIKQPICRSGFPFNLFWFGTSRRGDESMVVVPAFSRLHMPVRHLGRRAHVTGLRLAGRAGLSPEYSGNRPFMAGDSPRHIDARAWARLAAPATKEYDEDCDNSAAVILDTRLPDTPGQSRSKRMQEFETAVSLCASVAFTINDSSFVDLLMTGTEQHEFTGWPRPARLDRIHELLAEAKPARDDLSELAMLSLADRFYDMSQAVFVLLSWSPMYRKLVELAVRADCHCTIIPVGGSAAAGLGADLMRTWAGAVQVLSPHEVLPSPSASDFYLAGVR